MLLFSFDYYGFVGLRWACVAAYAAAGAKLVVDLGYLFAVFVADYADGLQRTAANTERTCYRVGIEHAVGGLDAGFAYGRGQLFVDGKRVERLGRAYFRADDAIDEAERTVEIHDRGKCMTDTEFVGRCFYHTCRTGADACAAGRAAFEEIFS